ncbi:MAG: hypothetical protein ACJZ41_01060, partial [Candidatus Pelagibacterales bacterium]
PDMHGALKPINTGTYSVSQMLTGGSILRSRTQEGGSYAINQTQFVSSQSLGNAIVSALAGKEAYFYDGLDGGFKFNFVNMFGSKSEHSSLNEVIKDDLNNIKNFRTKTRKNFEFSFSNMMGSIGDKKFRIIEL